MLQLFRRSFKGSFPPVVMFALTWTIAIFSARKRSLVQGNVFTRVCHSVQGGLYPVGASVQGASVQGGLCEGGLCQGNPPPPTETPCTVYGKDRAVLILLEGIFVCILSSEMDFVLIYATTITSLHLFSQ